MKEKRTVKTWTELLEDWQLWVRARLLRIYVTIENFEPYASPNEIVNLRLFGSPRNIDRLVKWIRTKFVDPDDMPDPHTRTNRSRYQINRGKLK